jgi:hypothetical protein
VGIYFRTDHTRLTFRELWGIHPRFRVFLSACFVKLFKIRLPVRLATLHEEVIRVIPEERVPDVAMRKMGPILDELEDSGARLEFYQAVSGTGPMQGCSAVLLPPERNAVISIAWANSRASGTGSEARLAIVSELRDGTFLATSRNRSLFATAPFVKVFRYRGADPSELMRRHQQHLAESVDGPLPVENAEQAKRQLLTLKRAKFEWNVRRGAWVPLTRDELERLGLPIEE